MYVEREVAKTFKLVAPVYSIIAVVGPRQAGKTTFLRNKADETKSTYVMLDDPDARQMFDEDIKKFENQYMQKDTVCVIDEVQYGKDPGRKLKYLADSGRRIWITSSSQTILGDTVLSWLVGRVSVIKLYPFSFREFLAAKDQKETTQKIISRNVLEQIVYGSYPKVVFEKEYGLKEIMLRDLYETMILKDVSKVFSIQDIGSLERFSRYLANSIGNVLVYGNVSSDLSLSFQTTKKYLDAMEKSYLILSVKPFYTNKLKEIVKQPKVYFLDTGLRNAAANAFPKNLENEGKLFENYVLTEMLKVGIEVRYWQTKSGAEVDFIVKRKEELIPIEVKVTAKDGKIERSLRLFIEEYRPKHAIVVFYEGTKRETKVNECRVTFTDVNGLVGLLQKKSRGSPAINHMAKH